MLFHYSTELTYYPDSTGCGFYSDPFFNGGGRGRSWIPGFCGTHLKGPSGLLFISPIHPDLQNKKWDPRPGDPIDHGKTRRSPGIPGKKSLVQGNEQCLNEAWVMLLSSYLLPLRLRQARMDRRPSEQCRGISVLFYRHSQRNAPFPEAQTPRTLQKAPMFFP